MTQQILNFFLCISLPLHVIHVTFGECANSLTMCTQNRAKFRWGSSVGEFVAVSVSRWDGDKMLEVLFGKTVYKVQEAARVSVVSAPSCEVSEGGFPHPLHLFQIAFLLWFQPSVYTALCQLQSPNAAPAYRNNSTVLTSPGFPSERN